MKSLFWLVLCIMAFAASAICIKPVWGMLWPRKHKPVAEQPMSMLSPPMRAVLWGIFGFLPALAFMLYLWLGAPMIPDYPLASRLAKPLASLPPAALMARLEARLRAHPDDIKGWRVLAHARMVQNMPVQAADAWRQVLALGGEDSETLTALAAALIAIEQGFVNANAKNLLTRALQMNPDETAALYLMSLAQKQEGDEAAAHALWQKYRATIMTDKEQPQ